MQEIRDITGSSHATIKKGITEYNLINYALNLEEWLEKESELIVDINKLKVTPFTRVFSSGARNPNYPSLGKIINLDYDEKLHPVSSLPQEIFDHIIYLVAKSSFDKQIPFDTRSSLEDVVGLEEYLIMQGLLLNKEEDKGKINKESDKGLPLNTEKKRNGDQERAHAINLKKHESEMKQNQKSTNSNSSREKEEEKTKSKVKNNYKLTSSRQNVIPESFVIDSPHIRVNNIILELRKLNVNTYPNASAILLRVLLDLSTQCFLKEHSQEESIKKNDLQGTITNALNYMGNQKILDQKIIDNVRQAIKKERVINIFNCYAHYNEVMPMRQDLVEIFDNFAPYIEKCLKKQD